MATLQRSLGRRACNMAAMMRHLGIWPETSFAGQPMEGAIRTCFSCRQAGRCSRWLADPTAEPTAWQRFCPNVELFTRLRQRRDTIEGLLNEPEIQRVMASDGVRREDLQRLLESLRPRSSPMREETDDAALTGRRVLIVEDAFLTAELLGQALTERGCTILGPVSSIERVLALLAAEPPDVALLDLELGGRSAAPVAAALSARGVPFVLVTGYDQVACSEPALHDAPRVGKPFTIEELVQAVARAMRSGA